MGLLFSAKKNLHDDEPHKSLTRYKRTHVRNAPTPEADTGIDPYDSLTRTEARHVRAPLKVAQPPRFQSPKRTIASVSADLHADDPISVSVLRRALPLRTANLERST